MTIVLLEAILQVVIILPFAFFLLADNSKLNYRRLLFFAITFVIYQFVIFLPKMNPDFILMKSKWNWDGKILGIISGIMFYFSLKKYFLENNFFTVKQNKENLKLTLISAIGIILISTVSWFILDKTVFNFEALIFQISLPGIDEEIIFRGILLGLLATALKDRFFFLGSPAIILTSILFGLTHSLSLNKDTLINFEPLYFTHTVFTGYVWGWITLKSRSILLAILSHNLSNFFITALTMI